MAKKCLVYFFQGGRGGSLGSENVRLSMFTIVSQTFHEPQPTCTKQIPYIN